MLIIFLSTTAYSANLTVTACGTVNPAAGDNVFINLSDPNLVNISSQCIFIGTSNWNVDWYQVNEKITIDNTNPVDFFGGTSIVYNAFHNFNVEWTNFNGLGFLRAGGSGPAISLTNFTNVHVKNLEFLTYSQGGTNCIHQYINVENSSAVNVFGSIFACKGTAGETLRFNDFNNSFAWNYETNETPVFAKKISVQPGGYNDNIAYNSVLNFWGNSPSQGYVTNTIIANNDTLTDVNYVDLPWLPDNRFIKNHNTSIPTGGNKNIMSVYAETLDQTQLYTVTDLNYSNLNIMDINTNKFVTLIRGNYSCGTFTSFDCNLTNEAHGVTTLTGDKFRPIFSVRSDSSVSGVRFTQDGQTFEEDNIIANDLDVTYSNINVYDNYFKLAENENATTETNTGTAIKLKANDISIYNNVFRGFEGQMLGENYDTLNIEGVLTSNRVYNNEFYNDFVFSIQMNVFSFSCDTQFYNNYLGNDTRINEPTGDCASDFNATSFVGFNHTDGKIYYYYIGNFYEENTACTDGDGDGFCDSNYTSGAYNDVRPLSSWPFDYTQHLLTADLVVDEDAFNVTLVTPTPGELFTSEPINFTFYHDSSFIDLKCDYIIDGVVETSIYNTAGDTNHSVLLSGFTNATHTYRVECFNDFRFDQSQEINFTFNGTGAPPGNGNGNGNGNVTNPFEGASISDLFDDDIDQSSNAILSFIGDTSNAFYMIALPIITFILIFFVIGAVVNLLRVFK